MSTTEVTTTPNRELVRDESQWIAQFERHVQEEPTYRWVGRLLKFVKGDYIALGDDDDEEEIDLGTELTVAIDTAEIGWEKWVDQRLVDQRTGLIIEGFSRPDRKDLDDQAENSWPKDKKTGERRDPWQPVTRLVMYGKKGDADTIFTFVTRSLGGINAVNKLIEKAHKEMRMRPTSYPVVALEAGEFKSKKHGNTVDKPKFRIVRWDDDRWLGAEIRSEA
jgi:hypothetical protein